MSRNWGIVSAVLLALGSGACSVPTGYVAREWSKSLRELGMTPVFPPREDVQVGDIYLDPVPPEQEETALKEKGFVPLGLWVAQVPGIGTKLNEFYGQRGSYPQTPAVSPSTGPTQPTSTGNVFTDFDQHRLRLVGFPMFMSATFNEGSLAAAVPAEAITGSLGAAASSAKSVTVSVPRAESCALPGAAMLRLVAPASNDANTGKLGMKWRDEIVTPAEMLALLPDQQVAALEHAHKGFDQNGGVGAFTPYVYVRVITEVYYARELDIKIESSSSAGVGVDAQPTGVSAATAGADKGAAAAGTDGKPAGSAPELGGDPAAIAAQQNAQLDAIQRSTPGVGARFVGVAKDGVSLRTTFERPVAIGYRYLSLKVFADGRVEAGANLDSAIPTATTSPQ